MLTMPPHQRPGLITGRPCDRPLPYPPPEVVVGEVSEDRFLVYVVAPAGLEAAAIVDRLRDDNTDVEHIASLSWLDDAMRAAHPQLVLVHSDELAAHREDRARQIAAIHRLAPVVVFGEYESATLRLELITHGAQDYVTRESLFTDHVPWTVLGSYGRWRFERNLARKREERAALQHRIQLARDLHDEIIQRLFACRLRLGSHASDQAREYEAELVAIIGHLRETISFLHGTDATLIDELHQLRREHATTTPDVTLTVIGAPKDVSGHVRVNLLDTSVTVLGLCALNDAHDVHLVATFEEDEVRFEASFDTNRPIATTVAGIDLGRLSHATSKLGGSLHWTWNDGHAHITSTTPVRSRVEAA